MGGLKPVHLLVLLVVILLLFGAKKLPEIAGSVGKSAKVFKKEIKELRDEDEPTSYAATGGQPPQAYQQQYGQQPYAPQAYPPPQPGQQPQQYPQPPVTPQAQPYPQQYAQPPVTPPAQPYPQPPVDGAAPQQGTGSHQA